jgi:peptide/nickel transport system permease protein
MPNTFWIARSSSTSASTGSDGSRVGSGLDPGTEPAAERDWLYTVDALLDGNLGLFGTASHHLLLPGVVLAAFNVSLLTRFTRSAVLEVIGNDYVARRRAKGMPERDRRPQLRPAGRRCRRS